MVNTEEKLDELKTGYEASDFGTGVGGDGSLSWTAFSNTDLLNSILNKLGIPEGVIPVNETQGFGTADTKISFTVPTGKILHITSMFLTNTEGTMQLEFQEDGRLLSE